MSKKITRRLALAALAASQAAAQPPGTLSAAIAVAMAEIPAGTINGKNSVFSLARKPLANTQLVFRNGLALFPGCGDYLIAGKVLTFRGAAIPQPGDCLIACYWAAP